MKLRHENQAPYGSISDGRITVSESKIAVGLKQQLESFDFDAALFLDPIIQSSFSQGDSHADVLLLSLFEDLTRKFTSLSRDIEDDITITSEAVTAADGLLLEEVQQHMERLDGAEQFVTNLKQNFDKASAGAVAIGERLSTVEKERVRVASAIEWMDYIKLFEQAPPDLFNDLHLMTIDSLRTLLPSQMQDMTWGRVSKLLFELRRVLSDINSDEVLTAQKNVIRLTEAIEMELLGEFEVAITALMDCNSRGGASIDLGSGADEHARKARQLAEWLQLFNSGQSLQKRYIYSVVEKRIPKALMINKKTATKHTNIKNVKNLTDVKNILNEQKETITTLFQPKSKVRAHGKRINNRNQPTGGDIDNESVSSGGASDSEGFAVDHDGGPLSGKYEPAEGIFPAGTLDVKLTPAPALVPNPLFDNKKKRTSFFGGTSKAAQASSNATAKSAANDMTTISCMDQLSLLFANINSICHEQFMLIRQVFPSTVVSKITRLLVQRIFNDPLFGIQARIDQVLCPPPPLPPLSLTDYLQALTTVREKLSSLYALLLEHCIPDQPAGSAVCGGFLNTMNSPNKDRAPEGVLQDATTGAEVLYRMRAEVEVREFLQDQINTVLSAYITDYFDKELTHLKFQFSEALRRAVEDPQLLTSVSVFGSLPQLRPDKMKSIEDMARKVVNVRFVNTAIDISAESANRMINVGRDDKRLPLQLKEIYLLLAEFLLDNVLCTCMGAFINMLLKQLVAKPQQSQPPPLEVIVAMAASYPAMAKLKMHFDEIFLPQLESQPNAAAVCKECRQDLCRKLEKIMHETLCAYGICVSTHIEKLLLLHQAKSDYNPNVIVQNITAGGSNAKIVVPSNACNNVCQVMHTVATTVKFYEADLLRLNVVDAMFKPIGQQIVGVLVSHIRRQRVNLEGAKVLVRDCEEYRNTSAKLESPEVIDMFTCLRDVSLAFQTPPERLVKKAIEELRHIDIPILLALLHARSDASRIGRSWFEQLELALSYRSPSTQTFAWEVKRGYSLMAFADILAGKTILGPPTLRRASAQLSALLLQESARALEANLNASEMVGAGSSKDGGSARNSFTAASGGGASSNLFSRFSQFAPSQNKQQIKGQYDSSVPPASQSGMGLSFTRPDLMGSAQQTKEKLDNTAKEVAMAFDRFGGNIKGGFDKLGAGIGLGLGLGRQSGVADASKSTSSSVVAAGGTPAKSTMRAGPPPKLPPQNRVYKKNNGLPKLF